MKPAAPASAEPTVVAISVDGVTYTLRVDELSALDTRALRSETGHSLRKVLVAAQEDPDIDVIAALVWLARRQKGETVSFELVAEGIGYSSTIESAEPEDAEEHLPEA